MMRLLLQALALYLGGLPAYAGAPDAHLLSRGPGAAAAALGGAVVPTVADPSALYWNPAGLAQAGGAVMGEHLFLQGGARYDFVGLTVPSKLGTLGLGALQLHRDGIVARSFLEDPGRQVASSQTDYLAGFARSLGRHWSAGATVNLLDFDLAGYKDRGVGLDVGGRTVRPGEDRWLLSQCLWSFGAVVKNLVRPKLKLDREEDALPRELRLGVGLAFKGRSHPSLATGLSRHDRVSVALQASKAVGEPVRPALGVSYAFHEMLAARAGLSRGGLSGGLGFHTLDGRFTVDYALEDRALSRHHRFTVSYRFIDPPAPAIPAVTQLDDEYARARDRARALSQEHLARGRERFKAEQDKERPDYREAVEDLALARLLDPEDAEAAALLRRAEEVAARQRLRSLEKDLDDALTEGRDARAYLAAAELLELPAADRGRAAGVLERLPRRLAPEERERVAAQAGERLAGQARESLASGRDGEALRVLGALVLVRSTSPAEGRLLAEAAERRTRLEEALPGSDAAAAARAARALLRAYPEDAALAGRAEAALRRYREGLSLPVKDRLHARKLYYLAAVAYAKGDAARCAALLEDALRRDAADGDADALLEAARGRMNGGR